MLTRDFSSTGIAFGGADKMSILSDSSLGNGIHQLFAFIQNAIIKSFVSVSHSDHQTRKYLHNLQDFHRPHLSEAC